MYDSLGIIGEIREKSPPPYREANNQIDVFLILCVLNERYDSYSFYRIAPCLRINKIPKLINPKNSKWARCFPRK